MEIHWRNMDEIDEGKREAVEARVRALAEGHTDLIDLWITGSRSAHHRHGYQEVRLRCQARGREIVAHFPQRNRIVSGMSLGTLVVESAVNGGAMITADMALEQNREVFAIPSPISAGKGSGTDRLIKQGKALLTESIDDILAELRGRLASIGPIRPVPGREPPGDLSLVERRLFDLHEQSPQHIDLLAERSGMSASEAMRSSPLN